jgi:phosphopantetheine--protein transferase-like protein
MNVLLSSFAPELPQALAAALPPDRRRQIEGAKAQKRRTEMTAAAALAFVALELPDDANEFTVLPPEALTDPALAARMAGDYPDWVTGPDGKPFENGVTFGGRRRFLSFSHSGSLVAAAVSEKPVGADVQLVLPPDERRLSRLSRALSQSEQAFLDSRPANEKHSTFFALWAMKESVLKLTGRGLSALVSVSLVPSENGAATVVDGRPVAVRLYRSHTAYIAAAEFSD